MRSKKALPLLEKRFPAVAHLVKLQDGRVELAKTLLAGGRPLIVKIFPQSLLLFTKKLRDMGLNNYATAIVFTTESHRILTALQACKTCDVSRRVLKAIASLDVEEIAIAKDAYHTTALVLKSMVSEKKEQPTTNAVSINSTSLYERMLGEGFQVSKSAKDEIDTGFFEYGNKYGKTYPSPSSVMAGMKKRVEQYVPDTYFGIAGDELTFGSGVFSGCCMRWDSNAEVCNVIVAQHTTPPKNKHDYRVMWKGTPLWHDTPVMLMHKKYRLAAFTIVQRTGKDRFTLLLDNIEVNSNCDRSLTAGELKTWLDAVAEVVRFSLERYYNMSIHLTLAIGAGNTDSWISDMYLENGMVTYPQQLKLETMWVSKHGHVEVCKPYSDSMNSIWMYPIHPAKKKGKS